MQINVKSQNNALKNIGKRLKDVSKSISSKHLNEQMTDIAYDHFIKSFPTSNTAVGGKQTDSSSGGWMARKSVYSHPVLNKTGKLIKSIRKDRKKGLIYSNLKYAAFHNHGTGNLPKRNFIGKSTPLNRKSINIIRKTINKILRK